MTADERRVLLALVDRRHAALAPGEAPLNLAATADTATDAAVVAFMAEWVGLVLETLGAVNRQAEAVSELRLLEAQRRTYPANQKRTARKAVRMGTARDLRADGLSIPQIALRMGVQPRTVERWLAENKPPA